MVAALRSAAIERGELSREDSVTPARAFELVRDMRYARASSRDPLATVAEWRGTCSGKHYLLRELFEELGHPSILIACTHEFTAANMPWLPPPLRAMLEESPVPDVHNFLRVQPFPGSEREDEWMTVDATWPAGAGRLGAPVNERFEPGRDQWVACDPIEIFHVPADVDPQALKQRLLETHVGSQAERRERFLQALIAWLSDAAS